jgi:hypothetical protein
MVIGAGRFVDALRDAIADDDVRRLDSSVGSIDQLADDPDPLGVERWLELKRLFDR